MSKAFTKDDDDAGFLHPTGAASAAIPAGLFRITATGARLASELPEIARAEVLPPVAEPERAALGVTVHVRDGDDEEHTYRLVTPEERALLNDGCSIEGPIGRALLGTEVGDVREVRLPARKTELEVVRLEGEAQ